MAKMDRKDLKAPLEDRAHLESMAKTERKALKVQLVSLAYLVTKENRVLPE